MGEAGDIKVPVVPKEQEGQGFESFPSSRFLVYKPSEGRPARLVGRSVMKLNSRGELVDAFGNYRNIPFRTYLEDSGISKSQGVREIANNTLTKQGIVIPRPLSYAVIDVAVIASKLQI